jgi:flagellin-like hook-associated protein FlgL
LVATGGNGLPGRGIHRQFDLYQSRKKSLLHLGVNIAACSAIPIGNTKVHAMEISSSALRAIDAMRVNQRAMSQVSTAMATGQRVTSAADDAASLDVGRVMSSQLMGVNRAVRNIHDGLSLTQTAEAALVSIGDAMQRMRELAVQAATGTLDDTQRSHLDAEYQALKSEILSTVQRTEWNGYRLLRELSPTTFQIQAGADANQQIPITIPKVYADGTLVGFPNGDFESSSLGATSTSGWTIHNTRIKLDGTSQVGGWPTPVDSNVPSSVGENTTVSPDPGGMSSQVVAPGRATGGGAKSLQMLSSGLTVARGFGVVHGPYIISNTAVSIKAGESVSFDWKAQGGQDSYDVYAYLLNVDNGNTLELLNATGASTDWTTVTKTVQATGNYKFVFVSGTYDATGGRALGARLFVDNITAPPTATTNLNNTSIGSVASANDAMGQILRDIDQVLAARASLGASLNRLTHAADNLAVYSANLTESRSTLLDLDYAKATGDLARTKVSEAASSIVLKQANDNQKASVGMVLANGRLFGV